MRLSGPMLSLDSFKELYGAVLAGKSPVLATNLSLIHKAHLTAALSDKLNSNILVLTPDEPSAVRMCEDINAFYDTPKALHLPAKEMMLRSTAATSREYEHTRISILAQMAQKGKLVVASAESVLSYTISPEALVQNSFLLKGSFSGGPELLVQKLVQAGYHRTEQVEGMCTFARRGGIVDFFSPTLPEPCRVEFWGDEIDSIAMFSIESQRRTTPIDELIITPARESLPPADGGIELIQTALKNLKKSSPARETLQNELLRIESDLGLSNPDRLLPILYERPYTALDHLGDGMILVSDIAAIRDTLKNLLWQLGEDIIPLMEEGLCFEGCNKYSEDFDHLLRQLETRRSVVMENFVRTIQGFQPKYIANFTALALAPWSGELQNLVEELRSYVRNGYHIVVMSPTQRGAETLVSDLITEGFGATFKHMPTTAPGTVCVTDMTLSSGLEYPAIKFVAITHSRPNPRPPRKLKKPAAADAIRSLTDLEAGNYVVHATHGIGVFDGIVKREMQGVIKDYIKIRYRGADTLFVPVTQLDMVSKYIGKNDDGIVKVAKLGGTEWQKTKQRVRSAVADIAKELIELYKKRLAAKGYAFSTDCDWQRDFELRFPYNETDDQLRCISEVKADMESPRPMDRLLCGDVGFGKTEVAIRAAFKCVMDDKQCAVLVPTTILAWQHYQNFLQRMEGFPIKIELLSRFRTPKQQTEIIREIGSGVVNIAIGTHRLLSKDVKFKDLGLCIIDEEQRFGVAHKERFKEIKNSVDVLTLSATPIPRTLNMAMSQIRDMSLIEEPPVDRHPVTTYVLEHDTAVVGEGIRRELRRGGQVFYLHNRVDTIDGCASRLMEQFPEARIVTAHGQMGEEQLSKVWQGLMDREIDILVCTTIIETGVDVANCNTLIIEEADRMGLSQLYQLRGRVGRSNRRAYAYLTFRPAKVLTEIATKRLLAIKEMTSFGSGFRIAMRDMELRGAGNILGAQQHGHMEAVGYEMYLRLLAEAVAEQQGNPLTDTTECTVDIQINAYIPSEYIENLSQRLDIYKKIAAVTTPQEAEDVLDEMIDRFGDPPQSALGLVEVALVRNTAASLGIKEISQREDKILLYCQQIDPTITAHLASTLKGRVLVSAGHKPYISVKLKGDPISTIKETLSVMSQAKEPKNQA